MAALVVQRTDGSSEVIRVTSFKTVDCSPSTPLSSEPMACALQLFSALQQDKAIKAQLASNQAKLEANQAQLAANNAKIQEIDARMEARAKRQAEIAEKMAKLKAEIAAAQAAQAGAGAGGSALPASAPGAIKV